MPEFQVRCYKDGIWDGKEPKAVEAPAAKQAAEGVCGEPLTTRGTLGKLRAEAWPKGRPQEKETFYSV